MIARIPIRVTHRSEGEIRGPTGKFLTVSTSGAEFGEDADVSSESTGFLPDGFATVGNLSNDLLDAVEEEGYAAEEFEVEEDGHRTVLYAVVEDEPAEDPEGWVRFEEVNDE